MVQELLAHDSSVRAIIENTGFIVFKLNLDSEFLLSEGGGYSRLGVTGGTLRGLRFHDVFSSRPDLLSIFERCATGENVRDVVSFPGVSFRLLANPVLDAKG